ncbi:MAG: hypothetical protein H6709_04265 [Kofleriaceae bacterium]|nr:hypothetical protein [Kofleriaceae bacterium]
MKLRSLLPSCLMLAAAACSTTSSSTPDGGGPSTPDAATDGATPPSLDTFYADAAAAVCDALLRCCDDGDQIAYFAPLRDNERLAALRDRMPPDATLTDASCRSLVADVFAITPFGDWVDAARAGAVEFDAAGLAGCLATLDGAACGAPVRDALGDGTCLGVAPPAGGDAQRAMFHRTAVVGDACAPLRDGVGAAFYGTCDPDQAFCCYADPAHPEAGCTFPFDGDGVARTGTCAAAQPAGGTCSSALPLQLCQTGVSCDPTTQRCVADASTALAVGDLCIDSGFNLLGDCVDSYCDVLGSSRCEPLRADGDDCFGADECAGGACTGGRCGPLTTCDGMDTVPPDAGVPDAPIDAGVPDAPPDAGPDAPAADGETCAGAFDLLAVATPSTIAGYDWTVAGAFGTSNDYNPYRDAQPQLPPACSIVYDAVGAEVVYAIELQPGQQLTMRYEVTPSSVAGGIYLLDGCGGQVTWPDYDGSGACGNNEYRSQGYCGALGCDPITWTWTYPTAIDDVPTQPKTFWLVLDHLAGTPTGYQLDLRVH